MWKAYKKRLLMSQTFIAAVCCTFYFFLDWPIGNVLVMFGIMQVFSLVGVVMGERFRTKLEQKIP